MFSVYYSELFESYPSLICEYYKKNVQIINCEGGKKNTKCFQIKKLGS